MFSSKDEFHATDSAARSRQLNKIRNQALAMLDPEMRNIILASSHGNIEHLTGLRNHYDDGGEVMQNPNQLAGQAQQFQNNMNNNGTALNQYTAQTEQTEPHTNQPPVYASNNQPNLPRY